MSLKYVLFNYLLFRILVLYTALKIICMEWELKKSAITFLLQLAWGQYNIFFQIEPSEFTLHKDKIHKSNIYSSTVYAFSKSLYSFCAKKTRLLVNLSCTEGMRH